MEELKQYFRPEFLNRLDEIIVFRQLTKSEVKSIADIMLKGRRRPCQDEGHHDRPHREVRRCPESQSPAAASFARLVMRAWLFRTDDACAQLLMIGMQSHRCVLLLQHLGDCVSGPVAFWLARRSLFRNAG